MLGLAALAVISLVSCKKANRTCECTYSDGSPSDKFTIEDKTTKKNAKFYCETYGAGINAVETDPDGSTTTLTKQSGASCSIK